MLPIYITNPWLYIYKASRGSCDNLISPQNWSSEKFYLMTRTSVSSSVPIDDDSSFV